MSGRVEFDGARQKAVCLKLQYRAGLEGTEAATRIGYSYPQAVRYFRGQTPIRPDQYATFARAYEISEVDLAAELAGEDVYPDLRGVSPANQPDRWTFRSTLRGKIPATLLDKMATEWEGKPLIKQRSAAEAVLEMAAEQQPKAEIAPWSLEAELREAGVPEWAVQRAVQAAHGEPQMIQKWIADKLRDMAVSGELPESESRANNASPLAFLRQA